MVCRCGWTLFARMRVVRRRTVSTSRLICLVLGQDEQCCRHWKGYCGVLLPSSFARHNHQVRAGRYHRTFLVAKGRDSGQEWRATTDEMWIRSFQAVSRNDRMEPGADIRWLTRHGGMAAVEWRPAPFLGMVRISALREDDRVEARWLYAIESSRRGAHVDGLDEGRRAIVLSPKPT